MRRFVIVICLIFFTFSAYAYVMGEDDRRLVKRDSKSPFAIKQVGQIQIHGEAFVTGLVTGENCDVVLSAGHAAIHLETVSRKGWRQGELRGQGKLTFLLDPLRKEDALEMRLVSSGYEDIAKLESDHHDWAIFRLQAPALDKCEKTSPLLLVDHCKETLVMPAFHFDKPNSLLVDQSCSVKQIQEHGIIVHDCDTKDGSSGAPLFCRSSSGLGLVGLNISGLTQKEYEDPGVYGGKGNDFDPRWHKNLAVSIVGDFYRVLQEELLRSRERARLNRQ